VSVVVSDNVTFELLFLRVWWVVLAKVWLARWPNPSLVCWTLRQEQRAPYETQARVMFTAGQCVFADLAAATDTAGCWLPIPHRVLKHKRSYYELMVTTMLRGLYLSSGSRCAGCCACLWLVLSVCIVSRCAGCCACLWLVLSVCIVHCCEKVS